MAHLFDQSYLKFIKQKPFFKLIFKYNKSENIV